ncbi:hypothetical protein IWW52_002380 [Coemansia sp. RSA 2704]|nr:hypothetical protein IWW52_002380 [Coemansia sp. RSA 2704]
MSDFGTLGESSVVITSLRDYRNQLKRSMVLPLCDLRPNLIATLLVVVTSVGVVKLSHGTDYLLPLRVADPTLGKDESTPVSIFCKTHASMPDIRAPGDLVLFTQIKTNMLGSDCCAYNTYFSRWQVLHKEEAADQHPLLAFLRRWWANPEAPLAAETPWMPGARIGAVRDGGSACETDSTQTPTKAIVPNGSSSRFNSRYLGLVSEMSFDKFSDLLLEVVHVMPLEDEPPEFGGRKQRCLVTDYTENPLLSVVSDIRLDPPISGRRLVWCTVHQIDRINKMPVLRPGAHYWMRNVRGARGGNGLILVVSPHRTYPRTIMVIELEDEHPDLHPMIDRRRQMLECPGQPPPSMVENTVEYDLDFGTDIPISSPEPPATQPNIQHNTPRRAPQSMQAGAQKSTTLAAWATAATITPVSTIHTSQQLNVKFRVRAKIVGIYPAAADQSIVSLADSSAKCLAMCPDAATACRFAGLDMQGLASDNTGVLDRLRGIWAWVQSRGDSEWVDLLVASVMAPGPGPASGALVRCLVLADVANPLSLDYA